MIPVKTSLATPVRKFLLLAATLVSIPLAGAQNYKIGDKHPLGGIVASVDQSGQKGLIVDMADQGPLKLADAIAAAKAKGAGWGVPYLKDLRVVYQNLHKAGMGDFKPAMYLTVDASSAFYRKGINFKDGTETTGIGQNDPTLVRFVKAFAPGTAAAAGTPTASHTVQIKWGSESEPWVDQGVWVIGNRPGNSPIEIKLASRDQGKTLMGQVKYVQQEGMLALRMNLKEGNTYTAETKRGNADWVKEGDWIIGGRKDQSVVGLEAISPDGGKTLNGKLTYAGEGPVAFKAANKK